MKNNSNKLAIALLVATLVVVGILGGTYAWLRVSISADNVSKIKAGALDLELDEAAAAGIRLEKEVPKSYQQGIRNGSYSFVLKNNSTIDTDYTITLEDFYEGADVDASKISDENIRYVLVKNDVELLSSNSKLLSTGRTIDSGTIAGKSGDNPTAITYTLYIWIDSLAGENGTEANIMSKIFNARLKIEAIQNH